MDVLNAAIAITVGFSILGAWSEVRANTKPAQATEHRTSQDNGTYYMVRGARGTKPEAVKALLQDGGAGVEKCVPQELSESLTLRGKKKIK